MKWDKLLAGIILSEKEEKHEAKKIRMCVNDNTPGSSFLFPYT